MSTPKKAAPAKTTKAKTAKVKTTKAEKVVGPKRPRTGFILYLSDHRDRIKAQNPNAEFLEIPKIAAKEWKNLPPAKKAEYTKRTNQEKERYAAEMANHVPVAVPKKKKDVNAPKRAKTAYIFYVNSRQENIRAKNPSMKMTEVMSAIGKEWKQLTDREKKPFQEMANKDKLRHEREVSK